MHVGPVGPPRAPPKMVGGGGLVEMLDQKGINPKCLVAGNGTALCLAVVRSHLTGRSDGHQWRLMTCRAGTSEGLPWGHLLLSWVL